MNLKETFFNTTKNHAFVLFCIICVALLGVTFHTLMGFSWPVTSGHTVGSDDAFISYRYAKNFFDGYGLVFNADERVEGYSNFLYVLLVTPAFFFTQENIYFYSVAINGILLGLTIYIFFSFLKNHLGALSALIGSALIAVNPWIWANSATGLETILVMTVTTALWISVESYLTTKETRHLILTLILCVLSILSRVDGFLLPMSLALYGLLRGRKKFALTVLATIVTTGLVYTVFRYFYYEDFIANTFYNKVSGNLVPRLTTGLKFLVKNLITTGLWIPSLILLWVASRKAKDFQNLQLNNFPLLFVPLWFGYLIWIGGDIYFERFLIALMPMLPYTLLEKLRDLKEIQYKLSLIFILIISQTFFVLKDGRFYYSLDRYDGWELTGKFLRDSYSGKTLAVDAAGKIPFFSNLKTIDMLGLNDKHIGKMKVDNKNFYPGHTKFDPEYVFSLKPDLIAAWASNKDGDLHWGLEKRRYQETYELHYLVNLTREDKGPANIVNTSKKSENEIATLISNGYSYAILKRKASTTPLP